MQKARRHNNVAPTACRRMVSGLLHSPLGVLFTFPSRYLFTIGLSGVFSLTGWCRQIRAGFLRSRLTQVFIKFDKLSIYEAVTLYGPAFQPCSISFVIFLVEPYNPDKLRLSV